MKTKAGIIIMTRKIDIDKVKKEDKDKDNRRSIKCGKNGLIDKNFRVKIQLQDISRFNIFNIVDSVYFF